MRIIGPDEIRAAAPAAEILDVVPGADATPQVQQGTRLSWS
jgi:hypothetical protein